MITTLTAYFIAVFAIGFLLGVKVHDKFRDVQDQEKQYKDKHKQRQDDGC